MAILSDSFRQQVTDISSTSISFSLMCHPHLLRDYFLSNLPVKVGRLLFVVIKADTSNCIVALCTVRVLSL